LRSRAWGFVLMAQAGGRSKESPPAARPCNGIADPCLAVRCSIRGCGLPEPMVSSPGLGPRPAPTDARARRSNWTR